MKNYAPLDQIAKKCGQGVFHPITHGMLSSPSDSHVLKLPYCKTEHQLLCDLSRST